MEPSVIFLPINVLILNGKENKEASAICFEIRIPKKKNNELLRKVPSKIYEVILLWKKPKKNFWFVNISEYHHRTMGLLKKYMYVRTTILKKLNIFEFGNDT